MFEGVIAGILNRFLGKYVQDLDTENLNIGIFSGNVNLTDLKLKPEALYELDLPIDVRIGTIGQISFQIPWKGFYTQPIVVNVQDVLILVGPAISNHFFDGEREKRLIRAAKKKLLQDLESENEVLGGPSNFFENLFTTVINNVQIFIRNIHIRYEDTISTREGSLACGLCLQSLSIETTNSKWKPSTTTQGSNTVYQMMKLESLSFYWNPNTVVLDDEETRSITQAQFYSWRHYMISGLEKFSMHKEEFEFLLKPITCKVKVIINRSGEARVPRLLIDAVLQDSAAQITRKQYLSICSLIDSFQRISISRKYRHLHPLVPVHKNSKKWWKYFYDVVLEQRVKPYTWKVIKTHRESYNKYKNTYKNTLLSPNDTELKLDLQKCEDNLPILSVVVAREQAKIELQNEDPDRIQVQETEIDWWRISTPSPLTEACEKYFLKAAKKNVDLCVKSEKPKGLWSHLSSPEKRRVCELIGYVEGTIKPEKSKLYIEHKINFTLANSSLALINRGKEVMVLTLTQLLLSLETRPIARAFKISARAESIVVEGLSADNDLVPMITTDNIYTGNTNTNFLSIDFEKNPYNSEADFGLTCSSEPIEIVYNEHALSEIINFFQTHSTIIKDVANTITKNIQNASNMGKSLIQYMLARRKVINISMDLKGPYIILPECGSINKSGNVLVIDFGRIVIKSDLQPSNNQLEDATCMELEEKLYDRLHADCSSVQVLFSDSGDEWRNARKLADSDLHFITKIKIQFVFSNSVKPDYKLLPNHKLNVTVSSLKLNLSDRRISLLLEFMEHLPLPKLNVIPILETESNDLNTTNMMNFRNDKISYGMNCHDLLSIKQKLVIAHLSRTRATEIGSEISGSKTGLIDSEKSFNSVEHSDDDCEIWARTVDLPGFDDNISPNNNIMVLMRFVIGEVIFSLSRSLDSTDKPYMMLRFGKICVDVALMKYGPALQISLQTIMLSDKFHQCTSGEYLELITTDSTEEIVNVLYRKVRSDCPDFKSHFHSVEQSLVIDIGNLNINFHREAWETLFKYLEYILQKLQYRYSLHIKKGIVHYSQVVKGILEETTNDPPIPPGATKFSYSFRLMQLDVKLSNADTEILELKFRGLESDCVYKANDRMILKGFLSSFAIDDLSDVTLYSKLLWVDEDKVCEMKYVRHNPRICRSSNKNSLVRNDDVKSDGSFKIFIGRLNIVLLYKIMMDLEHFIEPFLLSGEMKSFVQNLSAFVDMQLSNIKCWQTRLHVSVEIHAPILLIPQKTTSPNLIVFNTGDLSIENFFKDINHFHNIISTEDTNSQFLKPVIDNLLVKLESISLSRAVMTLAGTLEVQEPILESISLRLDIKRAVGFHSIVAAQNTGSTQKDILLYEVDGVMDIITINLGQRDLSTILAVWSDNLTEGQYIGSMNIIIPASSLETNINLDASVKKLQAFFAQVEPLRKEANFRFTLEGMELKIFSDMDEILSSPVRDCNKGLAKLGMGEISVIFDYYSDRSLDMRANLQSLSMEDIRPDTSIVIKKIFHSHAGEKLINSSTISVSTPPIIDLTFHQNHTGDKNINIHVEKTRLNFSIPFFINLGKFILDALPAEKYIDGGVVNHGYVGDLSQGRQDISLNNNCQSLRPPSSVDSTSGHFSTVTPSIEETPGLTLSIQCRKPEIMFFSDLTKTAGHALLFRTEVLIDYSHQSFRENVTVSLAGLQIMSKLQSKIKTSQPHLVLHPCDIEYSKSFKSIEEGIKMTMSVSPIDIHLSETTFHTITDIIDDIITDFNTIDEKETFNITTFMQKQNENEDLWSPKKISSYVPINTEEMIYIAPTFPTIKLNEMFTIVIPSVRILFEIETKERIPVLMLKAMLEMTINDWSKQLYSKCEINLHASYYNEKMDMWEPLIEPVICEENVYRPWEILIKIFQAKSYPISSKLSDHDSNYSEIDENRNKIHQVSLQKKTDSESETSADENDQLENGMIFVKSRNNNKEETNGGFLMHNDDHYISSFNNNSDSENEDAIMEKLASAMGHLFTGDSSDGNNSEYDDSSIGEPSAIDSDQNSEQGISLHNSVKFKKSTQNIAVTDEDVIQKSSENFNLGMKAESIDSGLESENLMDKMATYIVIDSRNVLNITLTSQSLRILYDLIIRFTQKEIHIIDYNSFLGIDYESPITLINDIGPRSRIELVSPTELDIAGNDRIIAFANYDRNYSCPSSPANSLEDKNHDSYSSDHDWEIFEGGFNSEIRTPTPQPMLSPTLSFPSDPVSALYKKITNERLNIKIHDFDDISVIVPQRCVNKLHCLRPNRNNTKYHIMLNINSKYKRRKIIVRSPLQIKNETSYAMGIFYRKKDFEFLSADLIGEQTNPFEDAMRIHIIEPDETYNVPIYVAYHCKLYFQPTYSDKYQITSQGIWWPEFSTNLYTPQYLFCLPKDEKDPTTFSFHTFITEGSKVNKVSHTIPNYLIRLLSPLILNNRLPYAVEIKIPLIDFQVRIEAGEKTNVYRLNMNKSHKIIIEINYLSLPWSGSFNLNNDLEEKILTMVTECDTDGGNKQLGLNIKIERVEGCELFIHAPYWIINKTGLPLQLRGSYSDIVYECVNSEPLLYNYKRSTRRKRVRLRIYQSSWSSAFGLDAVGTTGLIVCKHRERNRHYRILMTVSLSQLCPQLTKIVTLLPYFLVTNETKKNLRFMEENEKADLWIDLSPGQCIAFWPETESMKLYCKYRDSSLVSQHFSITSICDTVLRMDKGSALCVNVSGGLDKPFIIIFTTYKVGDAPVRIDNFCEDIFLKLNQNDSGQVALLSPSQSMLYTWDDPTKERTLYWNIYNNKGKGYKIEFYKDGFGDIQVSFHTVKQPTTLNTNSVTSKLSSTLKKLTPKSPEPESSSSEDSEISEASKMTQKLNKMKKDKTKLYWVSYLDNYQRVFVLTQEEKIANQFRQKNELEKSNYEVFFSLSGLGISICMQTNTGMKELSYISLTDSPAKWEVNVAHKWKLLTLDLTSWVEEKYKLDQKKCQLKEYICIDFEKMQMTKPFFAEMRRNYSPALWLQFRKSENQTYIHLKVNHLQIDNQLYEAVFPCILYPAIVPFHIANKIGKHPCIQYISLKRNRSNFNQEVYKYIKLLVQEFCLQLDKGFVNYVFDVINQWATEEKPALRLRADLALVHTPITNIVNKQMNENCKIAIIEYMHLSPLKIQLNLSSRGYIKENVTLNLKGNRRENKPKLFNSDLVEFLFTSWSSFLTDMKTVKLKVAYCEVVGKTMFSSQIFEYPYEHYYNQLIQQFYVLVLGLEILGNPFGLVSDFTHGLGSLFYEPFMGIPEGAEEIANRLAHGASSLLGHSIGNMTKSATLLSQSLGELLPLLSFDNEYKKKKKYGELHQINDLPNLLIQDTQTYMMSVTLPLSGIIIKPVFGERNDCISVIKKCGGMAAILSDKSGNYVDIINILESLRRGAERGQQIVLRARLPRFCHPYEGIKPFSFYQALGLRLLSLLERGYYVDTDTYLAHAALTSNSKIILLLTLQRIFLIRTGNSGSPWQTEWVLNINDIIGTPIVDSGKLVINVKQDGNINSFSNNERIIECCDNNILKWMQYKIESALILNMENQHCPSVL